jgi:hypothetical protein
MGGESPGKALPALIANKEPSVTAENGVARVASVDMRAGEQVPPPAAGGATSHTARTHNKERIGREISHRMREVNGRGQRDGREWRPRDERRLKSPYGPMLPGNR